MALCLPPSAKAAVKSGGIGLAIANFQRTNMDSLELQVLNTHYESFFNGGNGRECTQRDKFVGTHEHVYHYDLGEAMMVFKEN